MEELVLTDPVVTETKKEKFRIVRLDINVESPNIVIHLRDNNNAPHSHTYIEQEGKDIIKLINTGNFTVKSLNKRLLEKLSADGVLPGTVVGAPEP